MSDHTKTIPSEVEIAAQEEVIRRLERQEQITQKRLESAEKRKRVSQVRIEAAHKSLKVARDTKAAALRQITRAWERYEQILKRNLRAMKSLKPKSKEWNRLSSEIGVAERANSRANALHKTAALKLDEAKTEYAAALTECQAADKEVIRCAVDVETCLEELAHTDLLELLRPRRAAALRSRYPAT